MAPLIIAGLVALVVVAWLGLALARAAARGDAGLRAEALHEQLAHRAAYHEFEFSPQVKFLLALYAIGWEIEQVEWWPFGALDHDRRNLIDNPAMAVEWEFKPTDPQPPDEVQIRDGRFVARWKGA